MGRIFTYGCSLTNYVWPTWADIILYKNEGFNLGVTGGGAEQILHRILSTDLRMGFKEDDVVIVIFPTIFRWDHILTSKSIWSNTGQILNTEFYHSVNEKYTTLEGCAYKNLNSMLLIKNYLESKNVRYFFGASQNIFENTFDELPEQHFNLINIVKSELQFTLKSFNRYIYGDRTTTHWEITKTFSDSGINLHPRPTTHFNWVNDILLPHLDIELKISKDDIQLMESIVDKSKKIEDCFTHFEIKTDYISNRLSSKIYFELEKEKRKMNLI